jgi:putative membrane protein
VNESLALADACLSALAVAFMIGGWRAVKRRDLAAHRRRMLAAALASACFMVLFVIRFVGYGFRRFGGEGLARVVYSLVFFTHEPIAVVNIPLVIAALVLGLRDSRAAHREVARMAFPIWLYAALSGIAIYLLLLMFPADTRG